MNNKVFQRIKIIQDEAAERISSVEAIAVRKIEQLQEREAVKEAWARVTEEWRNKLEAEYGTQDHPKRNLLWTKAYDHGPGYPQIAHWYGEFAELLDP